MGAGITEPTPVLFSIPDALDKAFPYYLALGMSAEEYWEGDNEWPKSFREAHTIKQDISNHNAWLQGRYIYDAIAALSPILNSMSKNPKAKDYLKEPYALRGSSSVDDRQDYEDKVTENAAGIFDVLATEFNKSLIETRNGGDDILQKK